MSCKSFVKWNGAMLQNREGKPAFRLLEIFVSTLEIFSRRWKNVLYWKTAKLPLPQINLINSFFFIIITQLVIKSKIGGCEISKAVLKKASSSSVSVFTAFTVSCIGHLLGFPEMCTSGTVFQIGEFFFWKLSVGNKSMHNLIYAFLPGCKCVFFHFEGWSSIFQQRQVKWAFSACSAE